MNIRTSNYYKVLGVSQNASDDEIRSAYRKLARVYHPDLNPQRKSAEERFKNLQEAYSVLSHPDKRRQYDSYDENWNEAGGGQNQAQDCGPGYPAGRHNNYAYYGARDFTGNSFREGRQTGWIRQLDWQRALVFIITLTYVTLGFWSGEIKLTILFIGIFIFTYTLESLGFEGSLGCFLRIAWLMFLALFFLSKLRFALQ